MPTSLITQALTSNTTPAPYVASASNSYTGRNPFRAFDKNTSTDWMTTSGTTTGWLRLDLGSAQQADIYRVTPHSSPLRSPKTWTLEGSPDGTTWSTLDTQTGITWPTSATQEFTVTTPGSYRYYRLNVTANGGDSFLGLTELDLLGTPAAPQGTIAGTLGNLTGSLAATYAPPPVTGSLVGNLSQLTGTFAGQDPSQANPATLAASLPGITGSLSATAAAPPVTTSTRYANESGYSYTGKGEVDYEPPIAPAPAGIRRAKIMRVHQSIPAPTLVDGRPV